MTDIKKTKIDAQVFNVDYIKESIKRDGHLILVIPSGTKDIQTCVCSIGNKDRNIPDVFILVNDNGIDITSIDFVDDVVSFLGHHMMNWDKDPISRNCSYLTVSGRTLNILPKDPIYELELKTEFGKGIIDLYDGDTDYEIIVLIEDVAYNNIKPISGYVQ